ncbi:ABC-type multidrug transport system permease subunit [Agrococcus sp. UYP10]|uniref:Uncharacterized protein n=1 Tax=Agrococcus jenensis TaxID=46353 RepID=A0A3N2AVP5_9MICO|nr:hypothetical protein [Agrococcus jenensis]ROR67096.1 hypothetical protein EDD26_2495 [Agrococcus jenensis]
MRYVQFLVLFLMLVASFFVMGYAFAFPGIEAFIFIAGLLMFTLSFVVSIEIGRRGLRHR